MTARTILISVLALILSAPESRAQTSTFPSGDKRPMELTIRDNQGKLVTVPPGNPAKPVNYVKWLNETLSKGITDNAADVYKEAYKLYQDTKVDEKELEKALAGPWENLPSVSKWLTANEACLDKFREATLKRQCYFRLGFTLPDGTTQAQPKPDPRAENWVLGVLLGDLGKHRSMSKALVAEGWQAWKRGDENLILDNSLVLLRTARHLDSEPMLITHLVGTAEDVLAHDAMRTAMSSSHTPEALAGRLADTLSNTVDPPLETSRLRYAATESLAFRDACQRVFIPGDTPGTFKTSRGVLESILQVLADPPADAKTLDRLEERLTELGYAATLREGEDMHRQFRAWMQKPYPEAAKQSQDIGAAIGSSKNPLVRVLIPDLTRARALDERRITIRRATHLIVQLHVYHAKNRVFPERLDDLKTPNLKEVRLDPFSGKDFGYKKQGESFMLYSVAENLQDNGGQHDKSWKANDFIFWPVQAETK